jgi:TolB-like protein/Flp pilus assembly protein TadD
LQRRLAAILAADVVGYTALMGADEAGTLRRLTELRRNLLEPLIAEHHGRIVKLMGDGLLVEFASVVDAVAGALAWQDRVAGQELGADKDLRLQFRIGINLGDVIVEGDDIHGDGVNIAARLESLAEPGGICISGDAYRQAKGKIEADFEDMGEPALKNVAEPVRVYRVARRPAASETPLSAAGSLSLPDKPSIAVLPFDNMSADSDQDYFSDGITEDIITELSRFPTLFVIARNSSFAYKGKSVDVKQVARELGVRYVLEGSVRRAGARVRVTAQLIDSESGRHVWAERYDRDLEDIFALQEEITSNVVGSIAPQIEMAELARVRGVRSTNISAYDLALKAQALFYDALRAGSPEVFLQVLDTAAAALQQDPRCANALWIEAFACTDGYLYRWGSNPDALLDQAWAAVERLLEIDSSDPRGYSARGLVQQFRGAHEAAVADFRYAFALNPNFATNIFAMAWCESLAGYTEEAREHAALGLRLSPRDNEFWLGVAYLALAQASFADGDYEETKKWARLSIQMHPRAPIRRSLMIACCALNGELEEAKEHAAALNSFSPDFIDSLLRGDLTLYKTPEHNAALAEGLRKAVASR